MKIDIEGVLKSKMGTKFKWIPKPLIHWFRNFIHEDWINGFVEGEGDKQGVEWLQDCLNYIHVTVDVHGQENLPPADSAPCTFVCNHPLGGPDGVALGAILGPVYDGRIKYLVNDLLMYFDGLAPLCIPINKTGSQSRNFPAMVKAGFASDNHILMFPAGLCSRLIDGKIQDIPWKKTFIQKSVETQRDIVPIYFDGVNSPRFYRIARWCKWLGLKFNLAMLFLPDELWRSQGKCFRVYIGEPIPWQTFSKERSALEWADYVRSRVYALSPEK